MSNEYLTKKIPTIKMLEFLDNEPRKSMLWRRDRLMAREFNPYTVHELKVMFESYFTKMDTDGLSPSEVRLIETILYAWGEIIEGLSDEE